MWCHRAVQFLDIIPGPVLAAQLVRAARVSRKTGACESRQVHRSGQIDLSDLNRLWEYLRLIENHASGSIGHHRIDADSADCTVPEDLSVTCIEGVDASAGAVEAVHSEQQNRISNKADVARHLLKNI